MKKSAESLCKTIKRLTMKFANIYANSDIEELQEVLGLVVPMTIDEVIKSMNKTVKFWGVDLLFEIVKKLPEGAEVQFLVEDGHAQVRAGRSSFHLPTLPVEDFPAINSSDMPVCFSLTAPDLRNLIDTTKFAVSNEETRYYLNGIYVHFADTTNLTAVATDLSLIHI